MDNHIEVKNYMEDLVSSQLQTIIKKNKGGCFCEKCIADIKALALNNLPTKYIATEKGFCYAKLDSYETQHMIDVITAITAAIEIVQKKPNH